MKYIKQEIKLRLYKLVILIIPNWLMNNPEGKICKWLAKPIEKIGEEIDEIIEHYINRKLLTEYEASKFESVENHKPIIKRLRPNSIVHKYFNHVINATSNLRDKLENINKSYEKRKGRKLCCSK